MAQSNRAGYSYAPTTTGLPWTNEILGSGVPWPRSACPSTSTLKYAMLRTKCRGVES